MAARATQRTPAVPEPTPAQGGVKVISTALPYVTVVFAAFMPLAAGLYLITTVAWSTAERWLFTRRLRRHGGHAPLGLHRHLD